MKRPTLVGPNAADRRVVEDDKCIVAHWIEAKLLYPPVASLC
jgi:hypothetical protein